MSEKNEVTIPEHHQEICRAFAKIAKEYGLRELSGKYQPPFSDPWRGAISFNWAAGRHEADENKLGVSSEFHVYTKVEMEQNHER